MIRPSALISISGAALLGLTCAAALAALPAPTPAQQEAQDRAAEQAAQVAEQAKAQLAASMERIAARWQSRARENGWKINAPTPAAGAGMSMPAQARGDDIIRSEKRGSAPASTDVKNPAKKGL